MDDDDKTVFSRKGSGMPADDDADPTIFIPKPGGNPNQFQTPPSNNQQSAQQQGFSPSGGHGNTGNRPNNTPLNPGASNNQLLNAAATLIGVLNKLRNTLNHPDIPGLNRQLIEGMRNFERFANDKNVNPQLTKVAGYMLCAALDEAVMSNPWGSQSSWSQHSLLSFFYKETSGGEKFFQLIQKVLDNPANSIEVIELSYILLSLGFEGKYRIQPRGNDQLETIRDNLYNTIEHYHGDFNFDLSPNASNASNEGKNLAQHLPLWVVSACFAALLLLSFSGFRFWLHQETQLTTTNLEQQLEQAQSDDETL